MHVQCTSSRTKPLLPGSIEKTLPEWARSCQDYLIKNLETSTVISMLGATTPMEYRLAIVSPALFPQAKTEKSRRKGGIRNL